jgi:hypothetical protein
MRKMTSLFAALALATLFSVNAFGGIMMTGIADPPPDQTQQSTATTGTTTTTTTGDPTTQSQSTDSTTSGADALLTLAQSVLALL